VDNGLFWGDLVRSSTAPQPANDKGGWGKEKNGGQQRTDIPMIGTTQALRAFIAIISSDHNKKKNHGITGCSSNWNIWASNSDPSLSTLKDYISSRTLHLIESSRSEPHVHRHHSVRKDYA
jgi:hypothetical protein